MPPPDSSHFELIDEELVAYLDGQLDSEAARQVEARLASEDRVRRRLQELAQSWDMLDQLPHAVADDTFTRSTVQMVALAAEKEVVEQQAVEPRRRRRRWLMAGALAVVAASGGFFAMAKVWSDPNEKLVRDLSTIENVESYSQVGDIGFLRRLSDDGIFPDDATDTTASKPGGGPAERDESRAAKEPPPSGSLDTAEQRRDYLAKMPPQAREELRSRFETFEALSHDEQQKLRDLDDKLNADPHEDHLRHVLARYSEWLKTLVTTERAELSDGKKSPAERAQLVRSFRHEQELRLARIASAGQAKFPQFTGPDMTALHKWVEKFAANHETELQKDAFPKMKTEIATASGQHRTQLLTWLAWQRLRPEREPRANESRKPIPISEDELKALKSQLSKPAREALDAEPDKQMAVLRQWIASVAQAIWFNRRGGNRAKISDEDLHRFFETLPTNRKDHLLSLPADQMKNELRMLYFGDVFNRGGAPGDGPGLRDKLDGRGGGRRGAPNRAESGPAKKGEDGRANAKQDDVPDSSSPAKPERDAAK